MIAASNITLQFGKAPLFEHVSIQFQKGCCYGLIGANGSGKSTFLKILSGEIEPTSGEVVLPPGERLAVLKQDQFAYDGYPALETVMMGFPRLYNIKVEKEALYEKNDFTDADGIRQAELETEFAELDGWNAESEAATLLNNLGVPTEQHDLLMRDLDADKKVKVLLAQALFGNPDVLLLDEPTNNLDIEAISWLENFLADFENTIIVVSHDRHFLNQVCTHIADIDYRKIQLYAGNYDFWYEASQLALRQMRELNKKKEAKAKEMQEFINRFSANASKSRQATSRKKILAKINIESIPPSTRRYPFVSFKANRELGNDVLLVKDVSLKKEGEGSVPACSFTVMNTDKIAFIGPDNLAKTNLFNMLTEAETPDAGQIKWGVTTSAAYFPKDNNAFFDTDLNLVDWLRQYSEEKSEAFIRGFLGRMLFSGDEALKSVRVLSGGEKVRCMLAKMMLTGANVLILDDPTNHLDLESIQALNNGLVDTKCVVLFSSHDHQFIQTVANRVIDITEDGIVDLYMTYDEYMERKKL